MLFTFAGSSHKKYVTYLLETIVTLELESGPELRHAILTSMLINFTGQPGKFCGADFFQEYLNRLLEAIVERKGTEYGSKYIRKVIALNLHHFARIKTAYGREAVGLKPRAVHHTKPHQKPEVKKLLQVYQEHELHSFRPGRKIDEYDREIDDYATGVNYLQGTKLKRWVEESLRGRRRSMDANSEEKSVDMPDLDVWWESDDQGDNSEFDKAKMTLGHAVVIDGELVIGTSNEILLDDDDNGEGN